MGKDVANANDGVIKEVEQSGEGTADGTASKSTDSSSTKTKRGRGRGTGDRGSGDTTAEKEIVSGLASVDEEQKKRDERNAKRREAYARKKAENGQTVRPRKVNTKKKKNDSKGSEQIASVLTTVSTLIASRPNMAHWQLTPSEVESIATPLSNILEESEAFKGLSEHSDAVALTIACITILLPRIVISSVQSKERRKKNGNVRTNTPKPVNSKPVDKKREDHSDHGQSDGHTTNNIIHDGQTESWYGEAIAL